MKPTILKSLLLILFCSHSIIQASDRTPNISNKKTALIAMGIGISALIFAIGYFYFKKTSADKQVPYVQPKREHKQDKKAVIASFYSISRAILQRVNLKQWEAVTDNQKKFMNDLRQDCKRSDSFYRKPSRASTGKVLLDNHANYPGVKFDTFSKAEFGILAQSDITIDFFKQSAKPKKMTLANSRSIPGLHITQDCTHWRARNTHERPIISIIPALSSYEASNTIWISTMPPSSAIKDSFALHTYIQQIQRERKKIEEVDVHLPLIDFVQADSIDWIRGMKYAGSSLTQAQYVSKIKVNDPTSAFKTAQNATASQKSTVSIDDDCILWVEDDDYKNRGPLIAAYIPKELFTKKECL